MEFKLENLKEQEVNLILQALANMPYGQVFELINKIQVQANKQLELNS